VIAVFAAIFHSANPGVALFQSPPHLVKRSSGHVWMPDDVVRLPDQLVAGKAADVDEFLIDVSDLAFGVGRRENIRISLNRLFFLGYREVVSHNESSKLLTEILM
jgi:hypothetical protein